MNKRSKWKTRGILAVCLIAGLIIGFGAGFLVQRELKKPKAKPASTTTANKKKSSTTTPESASNKSKSSAPESTVPSSNTSTPAAQLIVASTPAKAITDFLKAKGIDGTNMIFSVVSVSKTDPNWKVDKGAKGSSQPQYFVLHHVSGGWAVVEYGTGLSAEQLSAVGAPSDLQTSSIPK